MKSYKGHLIPDDLYYLILSYNDKTNWEWFLQKNLMKYIIKLLMVSQLIRLFTKNIKFINYLFGSMDSVCRYMRELQKILKEVMFKP